MKNHIPNEPTFQRCPHDRENPYVQIDKRILSNPILSVTAKGYYTLLESNLIHWKDMPEIFRKELINIGILEVFYENSCS